MAMIYKTKIFRPAIIATMIILMCQVIGSAEHATMATWSSRMSIETATIVGYPDGTTTRSHLVPIATRSSQGGVATRSPLTILVMSGEHPHTAIPIILVISEAENQHRAGEAAWNWLMSSGIKSEEHTDTAASSWVMGTVAQRLIGNASRSQIQGAAPPLHEAISARTSH